MIIVAVGSQLFLLLGWCRGRCGCFNRLDSDGVRRCAERGFLTYKYNNNIYSLEKNIKL